MTESGVSKFLLILNKRVRVQALLFSAAACFHINSGTLNILKLLRSELQVPVRNVVRIFAVAFLLHMWVIIRLPGSPFEHHNIFDTRSHNPTIYSYKSELQRAQ